MTYRKLLVSCLSIILLASAFIASPITNTANAVEPALAVTGITAVKTSAIADNTFENGWKWVFDITVPSNETVFKMKFADWTNNSSTIIPTATNVRFYSSQSSNASSTGQAIILSNADTYSDPMYLLSSADLDTTSTSSAGRQIQVSVEVRVPIGTTGNSYSSNYGIQSLPDSSIPVIALIGSATSTIDQGAEYSDLGALAVDDIDGDITSRIVTGGLPFDTNILGPHTITYNVSDLAGNNALEVTRIVTVIAPPDTTAVISISDLDQNYDSTPKAVTVTTVPPGLSYTVTYDGSSIATSSAGSYAVVATITDPAYSGIATGTLIINKAVATVVATGENKVYDGTDVAGARFNVLGELGSDIGRLFASGSSRFVDKHVGTGKSVSVTNIYIGDPRAVNYTYNTTATASADITPRNLVVQAMNNIKRYDGNTSASAIPIIIAGTVADGDTTAFYEEYATPDSGENNKELIPMGIMNDGNGGNNYMVDFIRIFTGTIGQSTTTPIIPQ